MTTSFIGKLEWKRLGTRVGTNGIDIPKMLTKYA